MDGIKTPLGVAPFYISAETRISSLAEAISRNTFPINNTGKIKEWAKEIVYQCELLEKMKEGKPDA